MRVVIDAVGVRRGSTAVVAGNLLDGWRQAAPDDDLTVLVDVAPPFGVPAGVRVEQLTAPLPGPLARLWVRTVGVRRACARHRADVAISAQTASGFLGTGCPHGVLVHDLRHELRPQQFSAVRRLGRRLSYGWTFRRADSLICVSERTRQDVIRRRPRLAPKTTVAHNGADHANSWRQRPAASGYALAFGHFANKNVELVIRAWAERADLDLRLRICGLPEDQRAAAAVLVQALRIGDRVELLPWIGDREFQALFAGARCVLFPSDFEGFGLPAVEAMWLSIPVVISGDAALREVTAGHAVTVTAGGPSALAEAIGTALALDADALAAAAAHARTFTWAAMARRIRDAVAPLSATSPSPRSLPDESAPSARAVAS